MSLGMRPANERRRYNVKTSLQRRLGTCLDNEGEIWLISYMICIDVIATLYCIAAHRYWVHRKQVWVSGYKLYWNDQVTPIFMNTLSDMICIDVIANLCYIATHRYWIHCKQVWVSGYKPYWNDQMTPILMNALSVIICIYVITIYVVLSLIGVGSTVNRYEFQDINSMKVIKWRLYLWIHYQIWSVSA